MQLPEKKQYQNAIRSPDKCFKGSELEDAKVRLGKMRSGKKPKPQLWNGKSACVFKVEIDGNDKAVRCFTREVSDQQSRYDKLNRYIDPLNAPPQSIVGFKYEDRGIAVRGKWYPIVQMDWVEGNTLGEYVESKIDEPEALRQIADEWQNLVASLRDSGIAHNDLQHGNVMVQGDGSIRLVDYDGMFVPELRGDPPNEKGHPNYQHPDKQDPERWSKYYDKDVDNFPSLVIYLSLLAIAFDSGLWDDFHNDQCLIFTRKDYKYPRKSKLFGRLKRSRDRTVVKLAERLGEYCGGPLEEVPDLETVIQGKTQRAAPPTPTPSSAPPPTPTRTATIVCATCKSPTTAQAVKCDNCGVTFIAAGQPQRPPAPRSATQGATLSQQATLSTGASPTSSLASQSRVASVWLWLLVGGLGAMFAGWVSHTHVFLILTDWVFLVTGLVAGLIFIRTRHPVPLAVAVVAFVVQLLHYLLGGAAIAVWTWLIIAGWMWLIIAGLLAAVIGGAARIATHRGVLGRAVLAAVVLAAGVGAFFVVLGEDGCVPSEVASVNQVDLCLTSLTAEYAIFTWRESYRRAHVRLLSWDGTVIDSKTLERNTVSVAASPHARYRLEIQSDYCVGGTLIGGNCRRLTGQYVFTMPTN